VEGPADGDARAWADAAGGENKDLTPICTDKHRLKTLPMRVKYFRENFCIRGQTRIIK
jgi:hypothetical protein